MTTQSDTVEHDAKEHAAQSGSEPGHGPPSNEKPKESGLKDYFRIFTYADRLDRALFAVALLGAIPVGAALPLMTLVFGSSTSAISTYASGSGGPQAFQNTINHLVLYFVYIFVGRFVIGYFASLAICTAATRTTRSIRKAYLESTLRKEVWHFDRDDNGSAATQLTTNGNKINQGIAEKLYTCVQGLSLFFSSYVVALAVQWKLALITMSIIPAIFITTGTIISFVIKIEGRITQYYSQGAVIAQDAISSIKTIHAFGAHGKVVDKYDEYLYRAQEEGKKKSPFFGIIFATSNFLVLAGTALAFWEGYRLFQSGEIASVGTVFTVVLSVSLGAGSLMLIIPQIDAFSGAASAAAELFVTIDKPSKLDPMSTNGLAPQTCAGDIEIRNLRFAYPSRPSAQVLQDLNLSIPAGKTTALVGPSGCGKSTLVGLLERWYDIGSGDITLDGRRLDEYNTKWLRSQIRLVQQEPVLFRGTIFQNVSKGFVGEQLQLSEEKQRQLVEEACRSSNAHDFIVKLPQGYDTQVGERASMLSGGQRQRVAIARSIISNPQILLLDEATSALDPRAEKVVQDALQKVSMNKTTLVIAHKLATIKSADSIAVIANGTVHEQGTHSELIARGGLYAAMVRAQDLGAQSSDESEHAEEEEATLSEEPMPEKGLLQRTRSSRSQADDETKELAAGTIGYSLVKSTWIMLKEHKDLYSWYMITAVGSIIGGGTPPAQAILLSRLVTVYTLQGPDASSQANFYSLMLFIVSLSNLFGFFALGWACNTIGTIITRRYRREMMERMVYCDQDFFDRPENSSGALTSKLSSAPTALQELLSQNLGLLLNLAINIVASSALGIAYGWKLGLVLVFGGFSLVVISGYVRIRLDQKLEDDTGKEFADSAGLATEAVTSIRTISSLKQEEAVLKEYSDAVHNITRQAIRNFAITLLPYALSQSIEMLVMALGFWYGGTLISSGEYTISQFFVIFIAIIFGGQAATQFFQYTTSITKAKSAANYILWLRSLKSEIAENDENRDRGPAEDGAIAMEDVHFQYRQRNAAKVLRGVSITIEPGTHAAFVGPSGCGKSTVISLLERFYDPITGRITLAGEDISTLSPYRYRRYMSLVQQEPPLYLGSVRENISMGLDYEPSDEEINEACRQANALDFISSLPEGLNTGCGSKGLQFSGGQRQRIAVARALIRQPRLLLLDEATSALDTQSERIVQKALDEAAGKRTTVAVAHRLSTIKHADVIFVMEDGKIAETGNHEQLQAKKGRYYAMCLAQSLDRA